jgi:hypothetical protein
MKTIDIVILSNTANLEFYKLLKQCIVSIKSNKDINTNIILVETNKDLKGKDLYLPIDKIIIPEEEQFNYNKFLNYGINACENEYICISNNDVVYESNTLKVLVDSLAKYDSVSPWDNRDSWDFHEMRGTYEGFRTTIHVTGWCIVTKKETLDKIGGTFDEQFEFWYQDDDYSSLLQQHNLTHALIGDVSVYHLGQKSHDLLDNKKQKTEGMKQKFLNKWH